MCIWDFLSVCDLFADHIRSDPWSDLIKSKQNTAAGEVFSGIRPPTLPAPLKPNSEVVFQIKEISSGG